MDQDLRESKALRILILEDSQLDAELIHATLEDYGLACEMRRVQTRVDFIAALEEAGFDLVLADYALPSFDGLSALELVQESHPELPFILVSGVLGEETAIEALKSGATDYVLKHRLGRLVPAIRRTMREVEERNERRRAEKEIEKRTHQQEVVAELGRRALAETDLSVLMDEAVALVAQTLDVEYCKVLELLPEGDELLLRAGVGWKEGFVGNATVGTGLDSQAGYALLSSEPVIVEDLRQERRFGVPPLLHEHGVVSGMSVVIQGRDGPFGGLGAHTRSRRTFTENDVNFLQAVANMLAAVVERKKAEEELARSLRSKTDFLADVSHELRTPLTMIRTNAEVGLEIERDCIHTRLLKEIAKGSARMSRLIEDLLFLARSDSHSPPLELEPVAVPLFLAEVAKRAEAVARGCGATFEARPTGVGRLRIDPARIEQAVLILVDNAAKYSPPGSLVTLTSTTRDDELCVSVQDIGPGIAQADLPHIFERFYRGKKMRTDDRSQGGTGLGLAIARAIAEAHGGRIEAASQLGEGTRISLYLPLTSTPHPAKTATSNGETRPEPVFS